MKTALIMLPVIVVIGVGVGVKFVRVRRDLVAQRETVANSWTAVEGALRSRAEVMPDFVETVQRIAGSDTETAAKVAAARTTLTASRSPLEEIQANDQLSAALGRLLLLTENHPQLRRDRHFRQLEEDLAEKENAIAVERRKYNETLEHYNTQLQIFPVNVVAGLSGFTRNDQYFPTVPGAQLSPKVPH